MVEGHWWACGRPVPRSVAGIAHCGRTQSHTVANTIAHCGGTAVAHSGEHWWHTVVGARLGPNVPSASSLTLLSFYSLPLSPSANCKPAWCLVYQTSVSNWCLVYQTLHLRCQTASSFKESQSARFRRLSCKSLLLQRVKGSSRTFKTPKCKLDLRSGCKFQPE